MQHRIPFSSAVRLSVRRSQMPLEGFSLVKTGSVVIKSYARTNLCQLKRVYRNKLEFTSYIGLGAIRALSVRS